MGPAPSIPTLRWKRSKTCTGAAGCPKSMAIDDALLNYEKAINKGLLKVLSKMGISTLQSYQGAQAFEAIGLNKSIVDQYFTGTPSRIEGVDLDVLAREVKVRHEYAFQKITDSDLRTGNRRTVSLSRRRGIPPVQSVDNQQTAARRPVLQP